MNWKRMKYYQPEYDKKVLVYWNPQNSETGFVQMTERTHTDAKGEHWKDLDQGSADFWMPLPDKPVAAGRKANIEERGGHSEKSLRL